MRVDLSTDRGSRPSQGWHSIRGRRDSRLLEDESLQTPRCGSSFLGVSSRTWLNLPLMRV